MKNTHQGVVNMDGAGAESDARSTARFHPPPLDLALHKGRDLAQHLIQMRLRKKETVTIYVT